MKDIFLIILGGIITFSTTYLTSYFIEKKKEKKEKEHALRCLIAEIEINISSLKIFRDNELSKSSISFKNLIIKTNNWNQYNSLIFRCLSKENFNTIAEWYLYLEHISIKFTNTNSTTHIITKKINSLISSGQTFSFLYEVLQIT